MSVVERAVGAVDAARAAFADAHALAAASQQEVVDLLALTAELARIAGAQQVRLAGEIAERSKGAGEESICRLLGAAQPYGAIASAFGIRGREARGLLALAEATTASVSLTGEPIETPYARVAAALDEGELSVAQARAIVTTLEPAAPRADLEQLAHAEGWLVHSATDAASRLVPELLVTQARAFAAVLDPDGVLPNDERQRDARGIRSWVLPDGTKKTLITSPPEDGARLDAALDAYSSPRVRFVDDEGEGDGADVLVDKRTTAQKKYDGLMAMIDAQVAAGNTPTAGGEVPRLVLTGTIEAFDAYMRGVEHPDRTLTIEHTGGLVPIETADRIICDGIVQRAITDTRGHVLNLGREQRTFNRAQRRALAAHYRGCANPACGAPVSWTETHHVIWWSRGGPTDTENGILLCSRCHHEVHAGRLQVVGSKGSWRVVPALQPTYRYARNPRMGRSLRPATAPTASPETAPVSAPMLNGIGSSAQAAPPSLAVRIPDRAEVTQARGVERHGPKLEQAVRPPRRGASPIEHRLRQCMPFRRRLGSGRLAVDRGSPPRIVLRT